MSKKLGILISGGGTTAQAVIKAYQSGQLNLEPVVVISSRKDAGGLKKAEDLGIKVEVVRRVDFRTREQFGERLLKVLAKYQVDLVSQNGWMPLTPKIVVEEYKGRIVNQHPGPLDFGRPDFGGKGMYGSRVSCARIAYEWVTGEKNPWTEATIHYVTEEYDKGGLIRTARMDFPALGRSITMEELANDPEELIKATEECQRRLLPIEHENVIVGLEMVARGECGPEKRESRLVPRGNWDILKQVKKLAIRLFPEG